MYTLEDIQAVDPEIAAAITSEFDRQNSHIELIASENWVSPAVMSAMGRKEAISGLMVGLLQKVHKWI